jgi:hypothetical protein
VKAKPVGREQSPTDMADAIRQLGAVIVWCEGLAVAQAQRTPEGGGVHELGDRTT